MCVTFGLISLGVISDSMFQLIMGTCVFCLVWTINYMAPVLSDDLIHFTTSTEEEKVEQKKVEQKEVKEVKEEQQKVEPDLEHIYLIDNLDYTRAISEDYYQYIDQIMKHKKFINCVNRWYKIEPDFMTKDIGGCLLAQSGKGSHSKKVYDEKQVDQFYDEIMNVCKDIVTNQIVSEIAPTEFYSKCVPLNCNFSEHAKEIAQYPEFISYVDKIRNGYESKKNIIENINKLIPKLLSNPKNQAITEISSDLGVLCSKIIKEILIKKKEEELAEILTKSRQELEKMYQHRRQRDTRN